MITCCNCEVGTDREVFEAPAGRNGSGTEPVIHVSTQPAGGIIKFWPETLHGPRNPDGD